MHPTARYIPRLSLAIGLLAAPCAFAAATFTAPTPYLQAGDNPLTGPWVYSHLETFEDGLPNTPGLSAIGGSALGSGALTDSVDADDGVLDGSGAAGQSWYSSGVLPSVTFSFSAAALGTLPTSVGVAFTDIGSRNDGGAVGTDLAVIEVFDGGGISQGVLSFAFGDGTFVSATAEDRFVGATFAGGIGSIRVGFANSVDWEVDHVFYAAAVPEPAPSALALAGLLGLGLLRLRRRATSAERN
jgi:hypothetical protein